MAFDCPRTFTFNADEIVLTTQRVRRPAMDGLTIGRNVHFVAPNGHHQAAIIAYVWNQDGLVNLGGFEHNGEPFRATSARYSEAGEPLTWHWIERA